MDVFTFLPMNEILEETLKHCNREVHFSHPVPRLTLAFSDNEIYIKTYFLNIRTNQSFHVSIKRLQVKTSIGSKHEEEQSCGEEIVNPEENECASAGEATPPRDEFIATQALQDEEIAINTEKKAISEKKREEQRIAEIENHPFAKLLIDLIPFADQRLAPLPRVIEAMRRLMMDPMFYSVLANPEQADLLKIFRAWELLMKKLKRDGKSLIHCGWKDLLTLIQGDTFYTIFIRIELEEPVKAAFCDHWLNLELQAPSSPPTENIYTSSTCVTTAIPPVGATLPKCSGDNMDGGWLANALQQEKCQGRDGVISQFICHQENGSQLKLTTPGEIGFETLKIEVYPFTKVVHEERINWWRVARTRALVHFNGPLDPDLITIKRILDRKAKELDSIDIHWQKCTPLPQNIEIPESYFWEIPVFDILEMFK